MPTSIAALTSEYTAAQQRLIADVQVSLANAFPALNFRDVDRSAMVWLDTATEIVEKAHGRAVAAGSSYLAQAASGRFEIIPGSLQAEQLRRSLEVMGPYRVKQLLGEGYSPEEVARTVFGETTGVATRHVLSGARSTMQRTAYRSPRLVRVRRVAGSGCCGFCAMLATNTYMVEASRIKGSSAARVVGRGGRTRDRGQFNPQPLGHRYHDHCRCSVVLDHPDALPDGYDQRLERFESIYRAAREEAEGMPGGLTERNIIRAANRLARL